MKIIINYFPANINELSSLGYLDLLELIMDVDEGFEALSNELIEESDEFELVCEENEAHTHEEKLDLAESIVRSCGIDKEIASIEEQIQLQVNKDLEVGMDKVAKETAQEIKDRYDLDEVSGSFVEQGVLSIDIPNSGINEIKSHENDIQAIIERLVNDTKLVVNCIEEPKDIKINSLNEYLGELTFELPKDYHYSNRFCDNFNVSSIDFED